MSTRIEQIIEEMEDFIDECKYAKFSSTNIVVEREKLEEYLRQLKATTPEEIKRYQKIISNKEAILNDARAKADAMIAQATASTNHMISEHEIMQQAYSQAAEVCRSANEQAQNTIDQAVIEANTIRDQAMKYIDGMLIELQNIVNTAINIADERYGGLLNDLRKCGDEIDKNRTALYPIVEFPEDVASIENMGQMDGQGMMPQITPAIVPAITPAVIPAAVPARPEQIPVPGSMLSPMPELAASTPGFGTTDPAKPGQALGQNTMTDQQSQIQTSMPQMQVQSQNAVQSQIQSQAPVQPQTQVQTQAPQVQVQTLNQTQNQAQSSLQPQIRDQAQGTPQVQPKLQVQPAVSLRTEPGQGGSHQMQDKPKYGSNNTDNGTSLNLKSILGNKSSAPGGSLNS
ncbi:MAG: hypothetical protein K5886_06845 [Lachnospiraceae bacterium]|nr:hypothetical protein [Lachnospiraceae bacterium]